MSFIEISSSIKKGLQLAFPFLQKEGLVLNGVNLDRVFLPRLILELYKHPLSVLDSNPNVVHQEAEHLISYLKEIFEKERPIISLPRQNESIRGAFIQTVPSQMAEKIHSCYHYLLTPRTGRFHLGLFSASERMLGLATFSSNDLAHLNKVLPTNTDQTNSLVLSRLITFEPVPYNTATYFLSQASSWILSNYSEIKTVLTYLDRNLGFDGTIYKAFNAVLIAEEPKARYLYFNGHYVSDRSMIEKFGTADFKKLKELDQNVSKSANPLKPLQIFAWNVNRKNKLKISNTIVRADLNKNLTG